MWRFKLQLKFSFCDAKYIVELWINCQNLTRSFGLTSPTVVLVFSLKVGFITAIIILIATRQQMHMLTACYLTDVNLQMHVLTACYPTNVNLQMHVLTAFEIADIRFNIARVNCVLWQITKETKSHLYWHENKLAAGEEFGLFYGTLRECLWATAPRSAHCLYVCIFHMCSCMCICTYMCVCGLVRDVQVSTVQAFRVSRSCSSNRGINSWTEGGGTLIH